MTTLSHSTGLITQCYNNNNMKWSPNNRHTLIIIIRAITDQDDQHLAIIEKEDIIRLAWLCWSIITIFL